MIDLIIDQRRKDLGGFEVGRVLPFAKHRMVGPFVFFDHMGPAQFQPGFGREVDVRPHPISGFRPSPICSRARSPTATAWVPSSPSIPAR